MKGLRGLSLFLFYTRRLPAFELLGKYRANPVNVLEYLGRRALSLFFLPRYYYLELFAKQEKDEKSNETKLEERRYESNPRSLTIRVTHDLYLCSSLI
jgi:hypothetical protein